LASSRLADNARSSRRASLPASSETMSIRAPRIWSSMSCFCSVSAAPYTDVSGVLSSCEITAMNSSLSLSNSRSRSSARCSQRSCSATVISGPTTTIEIQGDRFHRTTSVMISDVMTSSGSAVE
jgi:hypothetical protein